MGLAVILSVGVDPDVMGTRSLVLQAADYLVVTAYSIKEAVDHFRGGDFDLVLLCQSIPAKDRYRLTCWVRASGSRIPVVTVSGRFFQEDAFADVTVGSDPATLLGGIREVLVNAGTHAAQASAAFDKQEVPAKQAKKPPASRIGNVVQAAANKQSPVRLARTG